MVLEGGKGSPGREKLWMLAPTNVVITHMCKAVVVWVSEVQVDIPSLLWGTSC